MKHARKTGVQPLFDMERFSLSGSVQFVEDNIFMMWKHPIGNIFASLIFYFLLTTMSYLPLCKSDDQRVTGIINSYDIVFYIVSFTLGKPTILECSAILPFVGLVCVVYLAVYIMIFFINPNDFPVLRGFFCFFTYYFSTYSLVFVCNALMVNYDNVPSMFNGGKALLFMVHLFFLLIVILIILTSFSSPIYLKHPFMIPRPVQCSILFIYFFGFIHFSFLQNNIIYYIRFAIAIILLIYCIISPPYLSLFLNFLYYFFQANEILTTGILAFTNTRDEQIHFSYYFFVFAIIFSLFVIFVLNPFTYKFTYLSKEVCAFYVNSNKKCKILIEQMNTKNLSRTNNRLLLILALHLDCTNMLELHTREMKRARMIYELFFSWVSASRINSYNEYLAPRLFNQIQRYEQNINEYTNYFWSNVLNSNIYKLPEIAGYLGREKYRLLKYSSFLSLKYPAHQFPEEVKNHRDIPTCQKCKENLQLIDFVIITAFIIYMIGNILVFISGTEMVSYIKDFFVLRRFTSDLFLTYTNIWDPQLSDNLTKYWNDTINSINLLYDLKVIDQENLNNLTSIFSLFKNKFGQFVNQYNQTHSFQSSIGFYPYSESNDLFNLLDRILLDAYNITVSNSKLSVSNCGIYVYTICVFFAIVIIFVFLLQFFNKRKQIESIFCSFRTVSKARIKELCPNVVIFPYQEKISLIRSSPSTVSYLIVSFITVLLFSFFVIIHQITNILNNRYIQNVNHVFSLLERSLLWAVNGVTASELLNYNSTYSTILIESLSRCSWITDIFIGNSSTDNFRAIIPEEYTLYLGSFLINVELESYSNWHNVIQDIISSVYEQTYNYNFFEHFFFAKIISFLSCTIFIFIMMIKILLSISPFTKAEQSEYFQKAREAGVVFHFEKHVIKQNDFPLKFITINRHMKITYASKTAKDMNYLIGNKLHTRGIVDLEIGRFKSSINQEPVEVSSQKRNYYIVPFYDFSRKKVKFDKALVVIRDKNNDSITEEIYNNLFYKLFPKTTDPTSNFPIVLPSVMKQFLLFIIKINGFDEWSSSVNSDVCTNYRIHVSNIILKICQDNEFFVRIRESSETIILAMKHESKTMNMLWKLIDNAIELKDQLLPQIQALNSDFNVNFSVSLMIFKTVEPQLYLGITKMQLSDFKGDVIFRAEEFLQNCVPNILNLTSSQKERMFIPNTTKYKEYHTSDGEAYDIFLVV